MNRLQRAILVFCLLAAGLCQAQQRKLNRELAHLPQPVRQAIRARVGDGKIDSIDKNVDGSDVTYDIEMTREGQSRGFTVDAAGALLSEEVFLAELAPAVQRTIQLHAAAATLDEIDKVTEDGKTSYDVDIVRNGATRSFSVGADGELIEEQVFLTELPAPTRQTLARESGSGTVGEIDKTNDDGRVVYDAETTAAGKTRHIEIDAAGNLVDKEVFLSELPAAVQAAIDREGCTDGEIHETVDDGEISYDVEASGNRTLSFDTDGEMYATEQEVPISAAPTAVQEQIKSLEGGEKLTTITKIVQDGETTFDVDLTGKTVSLGPDGKPVTDDAR